MEIIEKKHQDLVLALATLDEAIKDYKKNIKKLIYRDGTIQRFEYTLDSFWKYCRYYLEKKWGLIPDVIAPKSIFRELLSAKEISQSELVILFAMIDSRNLTTHAYDAAVAADLIKKIPKYYKLLEELTERFKQ